MKYILLAVLTIINSLLYALGGRGIKDLRKLIPWAKEWMCDKLWRRIGCAVVTAGAVGLFFPFHWLFILHAILLYGALTTYLSEFQKPDDNVCAIEWFLTGVLYGLAALPLIWCGVAWYAVLIRMAVLGVTIMAWSEYEDNAIREEVGRGFLLTATLPLLLIH